MDFENIKKFLKSINLLIIIFVLLYITNIVAAYLANFKVNDNISVSISMICLTIIACTSIVCNTIIIIKSKKETVKSYDYEKAITELLNNNMNNTCTKK